MQFAINIIKKIEEKDIQDNLLSRTVIYTITKGVYSYDGSTTLLDEDLLLSVAEQKALIKNNIKNIIKTIKRGIANTNITSTNTDWNQSYNEDV